MDTSNQEVIEEIYVNRFIYFPLLIWENTSNFFETVSKCQRDLSDIILKLKRRGFMGEIKNPRFGVCEMPQAYLMENQTIPPSNCKVDLALEESLKKGHFGWYYFDELNDFAKYKGIVMDVAMYYQGFVRNYDNWKLVKKNVDKNPLIKHRAEKLSVLAPIKENISKNHIENILVHQRNFFNSEPRYSFLVGNTKSPKLFFYTIESEFGNPGISLPVIGRGHIEPIQKYYSLHFENIEHKGERKTYVKAKFANEHTKEYIIQNNFVVSQFYQWAKELNEQAIDNM